MFTEITTRNDMERFKTFLLNRPDAVPVLVVLSLLALSIISMMAVTWLSHSGVGDI